MSRVGAVVVNYNAGEQLLSCVRSLRAEDVEDVVVVDNASTDGSAETLSHADPNVNVISCADNRGYGSGANQGIAQLRTELVLVSNADVVVRRGALGHLCSAFDADPALGIAGPCLLEDGGSVYPSGRQFPSLVDAAGHGLLGLVAPRNRFTRRYKMLDWDRSDARQVDWVSGGCFLARRSVLEALDGFDESYFMYMEDVDLCWRARRAGWRVGYEPAALVVHSQGTSTDYHPYRMIAAHHRSLLRYASRHETGPRRLLLPVVAAGIGLRLCMHLARRRLAGTERQL